MTKVKNRNVDKSYEVYVCLYQSITGSEEAKNIYKQFSQDFFDLVVVDECHRGSAADDAAWKDILTYFSAATQIGLTATPKETKDVSNIHYFGDPIYTYSLKQGIEDGYLAPYKVVRIDLDKDLMGYRPEKGKLDKKGNEIEDRIYNQKDFDRSLVLEQRTELVANKVMQYLTLTNPYDKTIVFCENIDHAERMRQALVNAAGKIAADNRKYIMRITGDEKEGKAELDNFIDPESRFPTIATTSELMTTGVDAQTCKLIVLDQNISSMTKFKQIIGRGTRINEDYDKYYFTIMDFKKATELFADKDFDGDPVQIYEPKPGEPPVPPEEPTEGTETTTTGGGIGTEGGDGPGIDGGSGGGTPIKYIVDDVPVYVSAERVQYFDKDGKPITESLKDYTRKLLTKKYESLDMFLKYWSSNEKKEMIIDELSKQGIFLDVLAEEVGKDYDPFDLICHVVFDQKPLTRKERANNVRKRNYFTNYGDKARQVLDVLLEKYSDQGIDDIENEIEVLKVDPLSKMGTPIQIVQEFGGKNQYFEAVKELKHQLYENESGGQ